MNFLKHIALAVALVSAVSCSVVSRSSYAPSLVELQLGMDDLEYLGETEISITYDTYLFIFSRIRAINGVDFDPGVVKMARLANAKTDLFPLNRKLGRASYLVYEKFPDADYFVVTKQLSKRTVLVLGSEIETCAVIKAYKLK